MAKETKNKEKSNTEAAAQKQQYSFKLLTAIVEHERAEEITELLGGFGINFNIVFHGKGTANSELMELLGLGDSSKEIVVAVIETEKIPAVLQKIYDAYRAPGVVFTIRLNSIGGRRIIGLLRGEYNGQKL